MVGTYFFWRQLFSTFLRRQMNCSTFLVCLRLPAPSLRPHKDANGTTWHTAKKSPFIIFFRPDSSPFCNDFVSKKQKLPNINDSQTSSESFQKYTATFYLFFVNSLRDQRNLKKKICYKKIIIIFSVEILWYCF